MTHDKYSYTKYNNQFQRRSYVGSLQKELVHLNRGAAIASMISLLRSANTGSFLLIFFAKVIDGRTWRIFFSSCLNVLFWAVNPIRLSCVILCPSRDWIKLMSFDGIAVVIKWDNWTNSPSILFQCHQKIFICWRPFQISSIFLCRLCLFNFCVWRAGREAKDSATS